MDLDYSHRLLIDKLGIKLGERVIFLNAPEDFENTLGVLPKEVNVETEFEGEFDFILYFTKSKSGLEEKFFSLKKNLKKDGMLWIGWPKKSAKMETDLDENMVMKIGLENGLVDVKVISVDSIWSGLKFVYRLKDRLL